MTDFSSFEYGRTYFPLAASASGSTLLQDADPAIFYLLEFYASVLNTHMGERFLAEAASASAGRITSAVAETIPLNPETFLTSENFSFPLLCAARLSSRFVYQGQQKFAVSRVKVDYVLPPLTGGAAELLTPILHAVAAIIDNRTERGFDPSYTPTDGSAGDLAFATAGVARAKVIEVSYGDYALTEKLAFPCVTLFVELHEESRLSVPADMDEFVGGDVTVSLAATDTEEEYENFVDFAAEADPIPPIAPSDP